MSSAKARWVVVQHWLPGRGTLHAEGVTSWMVGPGPALSPVFPWPPKKYSLTKKENKWVRGVLFREGTLRPAHLSVHLSVHLSAKGNSLLHFGSLMFELPAAWNFPRGPIGPGLTSFEQLENGGTTPLS